MPVGVMHCSELHYIQVLYMCACLNCSLVCRSIVSKRYGVFDPEDVTSPISVNPASPRFASILNSKQISLCQGDSKLLSTISIGILRSLNTCQKVFKNRAWNCSVFENEPYYLGKFFEKGS